MREKGQPGRHHYIHHVSYSFQERLVGAFVLLAPLLLLFLLFVNSETRHLLEERITLNIYLKSAPGVSLETPVRISGIEVGRVTGIDIAGDNRVHLSLEVRRRFSRLLREDSRAALGTLSLLGSSVIEITPGSPERPLLGEGAVVAAEEPVSLDEIINEVRPTVEQLRTTIAGLSTLVARIDPDRLEGMVGEVEQTIHNLRQASDRLVGTDLARLEHLLETLDTDLPRITGQVASGQGTLGALIFDETLAQGITDGITQLNQGLAATNRLLGALQPVADNVGEISDRLLEGVSTIPETAQRVQRLVIQLDALAATLHTELQQFPELVTQMQLLMEESDRLLEGVQRIWPISGAVAPAPTQMLTNPRPINE